MKNTNFKISDDDLEAISCTLSVLPSYDFLDGVSYELASLSTRIIYKLHSHIFPSQNELHLIAVAIDSAQKALRGELVLDEEALNSLRPHSFTINKLSSSFSALLDSE